MSRLWSPFRDARLNRRMLARLRRRYPALEVLECHNVPCVDGGFSQVIDLQGTPAQLVDAGLITAAEAEAVSAGRRVNTCDEWGGRRNVYTSIDARDREGRWRVQLVTFVGDTDPREMAQVRYTRETERMLRRALRVRGKGGPRFTDLRNA